MERELVVRPFLRRHELMVEAAGLRERKKHQMRQLISDTATLMFLERGFDRVRVAEVAEACGVSEKTVFNYFPTKESLVLGTGEDQAADVRRAVAPDPAGRPLVETAVEVMTEDVRGIFAQLDAQGPADEALDLLRRFVAMVDGTPALRAAQWDRGDRLRQLAARLLADRAGVDPEDPEPQVAAAAVISLWTVGFRAMRRHARPGRSTAEVRDAVIADLRRAGRLVDTGLWSFGAAPGALGPRR